MPNFNIFKINAQLGKRQTKKAIEQDPYDYFFNDNDDLYYDANVGRFRNYKFDPDDTCKDEAKNLSILKRTIVDYLVIKFSHGNHDFVSIDELKKHIKSKGISISDEDDALRSHIRDINKLIGPKRVIIAFKKGSGYLINCSKEPVETQKSIAPDNPDAFRNTPGNYHDLIQDYDVIKKRNSGPFKQFSFNSGLTEYYGNAVNEICNRLNNDNTTPSLICSFWAPPGSGKTRVALEVMNRFQNNSWNTLWFDRFNIGDAPSRLDLIQSGDLLIVLDDIEFISQFFTDKILPYIEHKRMEINRIRVVCTGREEDISSLFKGHEQLLNKDSYINKKITKLNETNATNLIKEFSKKQHSRELSDDEVLLILENAKAIEPDGNYRPLQLLLVADAICCNNGINNWIDALKNLLDIEHERLTDRLNGKDEYGHFLICDSFKSEKYYKIIDILRAMSTITGGIGFDALSSDFLSIFQINQEDADRIEWLMKKCSLLGFDEKTISPIEPDLLGEYYCFLHLTEDKITEEEFTFILRYLISRHSTNALFYIWHIINDFKLDGHNPSNNKRKDLLVWLYKYYDIRYCDLFLAKPDRTGTINIIRTYGAPHDYPFKKSVNPYVPINELKDLVENGEVSISSFLPKQLSTATESDIILSIIDELVHMFQKSDSIFSKGERYGVYFDTIPVYYSGELLLGLPHGEGKLVWLDDRTEYNGSFAFGEFSGMGTFTHPDKRTYSSQFLKGMRHGNGTYLWEDGAKYEGKWFGGMRDDPDGIMTLPDGTMIKGWKYDEPIIEADKEKALPYSRNLKTDIIREDIRTNYTTYMEHKNYLMWSLLPFQVLKPHDRNATGICTVFRKDDTLLFHGGLEKGLPNGFGTLFHEDGKTVAIKGVFRNGLLDGEGSRFRENGTTEFIGTYRNINNYSFETIVHEDDPLDFSIILAFEKTLRNGPGTLFYEDGTIEFSGSFKEGKLNGEGTFYREDGTIEFSGSFKEGKPNGEGTFYREDGTKSFTGHFDNGFRNAFGQSFYEDGNNVFIEGSFKNGLPDGECRLFRENGTIELIGGFKEGKLNGEGTFYREDGTRGFTGCFKNGLRNGLGKLFYEDGKAVRTECNFKDDLLSGKVTVFHKNGSIQFIGMAKEGKLNGKGTAYREDGTIEFSGVFKDNLLTEQN